MAVLDPVKLVIENYPAEKTEFMDVENNPEDKISGTRKVPFSKELWIDREDFKVEAPPKYFRLFPGATVRLKSAYYITCTGYEADAEGNVTLIKCSYEPESLGGGTGDGRKVKGTIQWVSVKHALEIEARLYDTLFTEENLSQIPEDKNVMDYLNPKSLTSVKGYAEATLAEARVGDRFQFIRVGFFTPDSKDFVSVGAASAGLGKPNNPGKPALVFNRTVTLKDSWAKVANQ